MLLQKAVEQSFPSITGNTAVLQAGSVHSSGLLYPEAAFYAVKYFYFIYFKDKSRRDLRASSGKSAPFFVSNETEAHSISQCPPYANLP